MDSKHNEYTDFGGGIKKNETLIEGSIRELSEESNNVFGNIQVNDLRSMVVIYNHRLAIFFLPINKDIAKNAIDSFKGNSEISSIVDISMEELKSILINFNDRTMYKVVKSCLRNIDNVDEFLNMLRAKS